MPSPLDRAYLYRFFLRALLWFLPLVGLWIWGGDWLNRPAAWLAGAVLDQGRWVNDISVVDKTLLVDTHLVTRVADGGVLREAVLQLDTRPASYGYSLPLFLALVLAAGLDRSRWRVIPLGMLALIPFQAWGMVFDILKQLVFNSGPQFASQLAWSTWQVNAIGLGYQLGVLLLPTVSPIVIWLLLDRPFLTALMSAARPRPLAEGSGAVSQETSTGDSAKSG